MSGKGVPPMTIEEKKKRDAHCKAVARAMVLLQMRQGEDPPTYSSPPDDDGAESYEFLSTEDDEMPRLLMCDADDAKMPALCDSSSEEDSSSDDDDENSPKMYHIGDGYTIYGMDSGTQYHVINPSRLFGSYHPPILADKRRLITHLLYDTFKNVQSYYTRLNLLAMLVGMAESQPGARPFTHTDATRPTDPKADLTMITRIVWTCHDPEFLDAMSDLICLCVGDKK